MLTAENVLGPKSNRVKRIYLYFALEKNVHIAVKSQTLRGTHSSE